MKHISWTRNQACVCREVSSMRQMTHSRSQNGWGCHFYRKHVVLQFDACRASFWFTIIFAFIGNMMLLIWWACVLRNKKFLHTKCLGRFLYLISKNKKYWFDGINNIYKTLYINKNLAKFIQYLITWFAYYIS